MHRDRLTVIGINVDEPAKRDAALRLLAEKKLSLSIVTASFVMQVTVVTTPKISEAPSMPRSRPADGQRRIPLWRAARLMRHESEAEAHQ